MATARPLAFLLSFIYLIVGVAGQTCYYPDGSTDSGHFACSSGGTSVCCAEGFQCLSNGLCNDARYENYERVLRGGCTDKNWGAGCPQRCTSIWPQGDEGVYVCNNGKFCCGRSDECCNDSGAELYDFGDPTVIATAGKTTAQATSAPEDEEAPQSTTEAEQAQSSAKEQDQGQQSHSQTKVSSQLTTVKEQDEAQQTQDPQEDVSAATKGNVSPTKDSSEPQATEETANTSKKNSSSDASTEDEKDATKIVTRTATDPATQNGASQAAGSGSGSSPVATNTINNYISTPAPSNNNVPIAIGVGVGVGLLVFLLAIAGCWYIRRKRRGPSPRSRSVFEIGESASPAVEIQNSTAVLASEKSWRNPFGRGSGQVFEMDGGRRSVELPVGVEPKEMHGESAKFGSESGMDKKWPGEFR